MRTLQVRAVCDGDGCEMIEFYDMPIRFSGPNISITKSLLGPPGWIMGDDKIYCSKNCKQNKKNIDPTSSHLKEEIRLDWKDWQEYCKVRHESIPIFSQSNRGMTSPINYDYYSDNY